MKRISYIGRFRGEKLRELKGYTNGRFYVSQRYLVAVEPSKGNSFIVAIFHKSIKDRFGQPKLINKRYMQNITKANNYLENLGFER